MLAGLKEKPEKPCGTLLVEFAGERVSYPEDDGLTAGSGACRACRREGRNPKTGGKPCGGYINAGYSPYPCKTCGRAYDQHE